MKLLFFLVLILFSLGASQNIYISNDIFKIIIDYTDSLKTIKALNKSDKNLYQLTSPLLNIYQCFNREGIIYDTIGKKIFPDTTIENDIFIRYNKSSLAAPLIMYSFFPCAHTKNIKTIIDDPLDQPVSNEEKLNHNTGKKLFPVVIYKNGSRNIRNIKVIYNIDCNNVVYNMARIKKEANFCEQFFIHITFSECDYRFGIEKLFRVIESLTKCKKIKIIFNNIGRLFFLSLDQLPKDVTKNIIDCLLKKSQNIEFCIDTIDPLLIRYLPFDKEKREKYLQVLCAAKNITSVEKTLLYKLDALKCIDELINSRNANSFVFSEESIFNVRKELSSEELKLCDEIFSPNAEEKKKATYIIRKKEILKWRTSLFKFIFIAICFTSLNTQCNFKKFNVNKRHVLQVSLISSVSALFLIILSRKQRFVHF